MSGLPESPNNLPIRKAAVIGAGSMGSGIAAQFANAGVPVVLLDVARSEGPKDAIAAAGVARQLKAGGFMHPDAAKLVETGTIEDDLGRLADADWIVEAIVERLDVKRSLYERLEKVRKADAVVSSNTSTLRLAKLTDGLSPALRKHLLITHFFNPPRHMRLVEVVSSAETDRAAVEKASAAADIVLGKTVVIARDTPGFIANRIGCTWMAVAAVEALRHGLTIEEADAVLSAPFGVPRTGVFGLFDLIGIDLVPPIWGSLRDALPEGDLIQRYELTTEPVFATLLERKLFGRKSGGGFYRLAKDKSRETFDVAALEYRPERPVQLASLTAARGDLRALIETGDPAGRLAWRVLSELVLYAAGLADEIAMDPADVDVAMRLGYSWASGPFALADKVGVRYIADRLASEGRELPPLLAEAADAGRFFASDGSILGRGSQARTTAGRYLRLSDAKAKRPPVLENAGAALLDIGEGVACFEFRNRMNLFDEAVFDAIEQSIERAPKDFRAIVIGNDDPRAFSAGANLRLILAMAEAGDMAAVERFVARGQTVFQQVKYSPIPIVGAPFGLALGGGCEVLLHSAGIVAHAELNVGLPEVKVGIVPGWGGSTQLLLRFAERLGAEAAAEAAFRVIVSGRASTSALDARDMAILRPTDRIVMNRDRLVEEARAAAVVLADAGFRPPAPASPLLIGSPGKEKLLNAYRAGEGAASTETDLVIAEAVADILTGAPLFDRPTAVTEDDVMRLERDALVRLAGTPATQARMRHMLETGKPLRN